jgi:glycine oxidase
MNNQYDAIILGRGIAGLGCAIALAKRGRKVLVLERSGLRGQATPASAGILDPMLEMKPGSPLLTMRMKGFKAYPGQLRNLERQTGIRTGYIKSGMLYVALTAGEEKALLKKASWHRKAGLPVEYLGAAAVLKKFPYLTPRVRSAVYYSTMGKVNPRLLQRALQVRAKRVGIHFGTFRGAFRFQMGKQGIEGLRAGKRWIQTRAVVKAMGSWAGKPDNAGIRVPVKPVRGQVLILKGALPVSTILHSMNGHYLVPWSKNRYLLGSTVESVGFRAGVTRQALRKIRRGIEKLVPQVKRLALETAWSGLRPRTPDHMPVIGPDRIPGLFWATGYYRSGILIGIEAGELLAQAMITGHIPEGLKPFQPRRFLKNRRRGQAILPCLSPSEKPEAHHGK